jgi:pyrroline-5-carboxylate reductase
MAFDTILIVGCGNMAGAMLQGWLAAGLAPERFTVADPAPRELPGGVRKLDAIPSSGGFDVVVLGVKPQTLAEVAPQVEALAGAGTSLVSVLAGVELAVLEQRFPRAGGLVRVIPNLAAALGMSPMAVAERRLDESGRQAVFELLAPLGKPVWIGETHFDLVTALAGSGPAFVYRFIDALAAASTDLGLPADKAKNLALAMVEGAAALAASSPHDPAELARRVTSPGGTTQAGLAELDAGDSLRVLLEKTLGAARDRSAELAAAARREG